MNQSIPAHIGVAIGFLFLCVCGCRSTGLSNDLDANSDRLLESVISKVLYVDREGKTGKSYKTSSRGSKAVHSSTR